MKVKLFVFVLTLFGSLTCWADELSADEQAVWDLENSTQAGVVKTKVTGTSVIPAIVIPVPLIARTQAAACKGLANHLKAFIVNEGPST